MHCGFTATALELQLGGNSLITNGNLPAVVNSSWWDLQVLLGVCVRGGCGVLGSLSTGVLCKTQDRWLVYPG